MKRLLLTAALATTLGLPVAAPASARILPQCDNRAAVRQLEDQKHDLERRLHAMSPPQRRAARPQFEAQKRALDAQKRELNRQRKACERANKPPKHRRPLDRDGDRDRF